MKGWLLPTLLASAALSLWAWALPPGGQERAVTLPELQQALVKLQWRFTPLQPLPLRVELDEDIRGPRDGWAGGGDTRGWWQGGTIAIDPALDFGEAMDVLAHEYAHALLELAPGHPCERAHCAHWGAVYGDIYSWMRGELE